MAVRILNKDSWGAEMATEVELMKLKMYRRMN